MSIRTLEVGLRLEAMQIEKGAGVLATSHISERSADLKTRAPRKRPHIQTPVSIIRNLLGLSKTLGSNAMAYHFAPSFESLQTTQPYLYFETGRAVSRNKISKQHKQGIGRAHDQIIKDGK